MRIAIYLLASVLATSAFGGAIVGTALQEPLNSELKVVVEKTNELHQAFFDQNESQIDTALNGLISEIDQLDQSSRILKDFEREHLLKALLAIRDLAERIKADSVTVRRVSSSPDGQAAAVENRRADGQEIFRQLTHLSRIYNVKGNYHVFFCGSDRAFWLQSGRRAENPVHPETLRNCGSMIR